MSACVPIHGSWYADWSWERVVPLLRGAEQWVGDNSFQMLHMDLVTWKLDFPRDTPHPKPEITSASTGTS